MLEEIIGIDNMRRSIMLQVSTDPAAHIDLARLD